MSFNDMNEYRTGYYAPIVSPPPMKVYELRVQGSIDIDDLTPPSGKRFMVHGFMASMLVPSALTSNLRATLALGTGHTSDASKILASFRTIAKDTIPCACLMGINVLADVDEIVRLTNITYSVGDVITRVVVYYTVV